MIKSDTLKALAPALVAAQKKMGVALKDAKNPFFKSKFADLNSVIDAAMPALNDVGIAVLQTPGMNLAGKAVIQTILLHESGEFLGSETEITVAKANDPQAAGSAISYARRYGLQATVTLKAVDDDGETAMGRATSAVKVETTAPSTTVSAKVETTEAPKKKVSFSKKSLTTPTISAGDDI